MRYFSRAVLAVALLVGFYVVALAIVIAVIAGVVEAFNLGASGAVLVKVAIPAALIVIAVVRGVFSRAERLDTARGLLVDEQDEPGLWADVRRLAAAAQTRVPDEIRLVAEVNASVVEDARFLGLVAGTRRLEVGVPLLIGLSGDEARSVLAHELGHYSRRHTALAPLTYRGGLAIARVHANLGPESLTGRLVSGYARLYHAASFAVSRRQELEADALAAQLVGRDVAVSALERVGPLSSAWSFFLHRYAGMGAEEGHRPAHLLAGFEALVAEPHVQRQLLEMVDDAEPEQSSFDSHPPTSVRVAALRAGATSSTPADSDPSIPGLRLLADPAAVFARLEAVAYADDPRAAVDWDVLAADYSRDRAAQAEGWLRERAESLGLPTTVRALVDRLDAAGTPGLLTPDELARATASAEGAGEADEGHPGHVGVDDPIAPVLDPERGVLCSALADLAAVRLVGAGLGSFSISWATTVSVRDQHGAVVEVGERTTITPGGGPAALTTLAGWGVDVDAELAPAPQRASEQLPVDAASDEVLGGGLGSLTRRAALLLFTHRELIVRRLDISDRRGIAGGNLSQRGPGAMVARVASRSVAELEADPRSSVTPYSSMTSVHLRRGRWPSMAHNWGRVLRLSITPVDGSTMLVKVPDNALVGEPLEAFAHYLGERLTVEDPRAEG